MILKIDGKQELPSNLAIVWFPSSNLDGFLAQYLTRFRIDCAKLFIVHDFKFDGLLLYLCGYVPLAWRLDPKYSLFDAKAFSMEFWQKKSWSLTSFLLYLVLVNITL
jgi:hypothetical protein